MIGTFLFTGTYIFTGTPLPLNILIQGKISSDVSSEVKSYCVCFLTWKFASFCRSFPNAIRSPSLWWRSAYKFGDAAIRTDFCTHPDGVSYRPTYTHTFPWTPAKIIRAEVHSRCHSRYFGSLPSNTLISLFCVSWWRWPIAHFGKQQNFGKTSPSLFSVSSFIHFQFLPICRIMCSDHTFRFTSMRREPYRYE